MERDDRPAESWRVVGITTLPPVVGLMDQLLGSLGHRLVGLVTTPGPEQRRSTGYIDVVRMARPGIDVIVTSHPRRMAAMLAPFRPDLILCASFPWRIPPEVLALPRLGAINVHPARLPKYRGPNAPGWALRNGDAELGVTIHRMDADFDTGPILAQGGVPIDDDDDITSLFGAMGRLAAGLLVQALARVARGEAGEAQDESQASYAPLFEESDRRIDWSRPAREVHNQVRAWSGIGDVAAGAFGEVAGAPLTIIRTRLLPGGETAASPGTVLAGDPAAGAFVVQCGDGPLEVLAAQPPPES